MPQYEHREQNQSQLSRRKFLYGAGAATTAAFVGANTKLFIEHLDSEEVSEPEVVVEKAAEPESIEVEPKLTSENFDRWKTGYQAWWVMPYHSVVFVDENNEPVSLPIPFEEFTVDKLRNRDGKEVMEPYLLTPGAMDEAGFLTGNLASEWLRYVKAKAAKENRVDEAELQLVHITEEFEKAIHDSGDEILVAKIYEGEISRIVDLVHYNADVPAGPDDPRDRITYISEELAFSEPSITPLMTSELRALVPALCAKESLFKDRKKNSKGAQGIAQFKSSVWEKLGFGEYGESQPFTKQVEAIGLQFGQIYRELVSNPVVTAMLVDMETLFASRESFEKNCLVPLMVNSYNCGAKRMKEVVQTFVEKYPVEKLREWYAPIDGMDLFFAMSQHGVKSGVDEYGSDSSQYVGYIYALRDVFEAEQQSDDVRLASNE